MITQAWLRGKQYNELKFVPDLVLDGKWENDPVKTRKMLVERLKALGMGKWYRIDAFVTSIKRDIPDFQRPAGNYEAWSISSRKSGESLRGYAHWDEVDGALIRYLVRGPMHWLGLVDLGGSRRGHGPESFRLSRWFDKLLSGKPVDEMNLEEGKITVMRNGRVTCARDCSRVLRYQVARFCIRIEPDHKGYHYELNHNSLQRAISQGLQVDQLLALLSRHATSGIPASIKDALTRWHKTGTQVEIQSIVVLKAADPEVIAEIRASALGRFLGEVLSPTIVIVPAGVVEKMVPRLLELGYFCDFSSSGLSVERRKG